MGVAPAALMLGGASWLAVAGWQQFPALAVAGGVSVAVGAAWQRLGRRPVVVADDAPQRPVLLVKRQLPPDDRLSGPEVRLPHPDELGPITAPPTGETLGIVEVALAELAPMRFVALSGGEFTMGSPDTDPGRYDDEGPQHRVYVSPLAVAEHPVTQGQWRAVMKDNPSDPNTGIGDDLPVNSITWFQAVAFLNRLSILEGRTPCYTEVSEESWRWSPFTDGYRLPTEAEWEFAARAGTTSAYSFGDDPAQLNEHAWYGENSENRLHPVGGLQMNPWGLFDMHGLVREWKWQAFDTYVNRSTSDPLEKKRHPRRRSALTAPSRVDLTCTTCVQLPLDNGQRGKRN